jgi:hypothetical protein
VGHAEERAEVAVVARLADRLQVELDVALGEGVVVLAQQAQEDAVREHGPTIAAAGVEESLEHIVRRFGLDAPARVGARVEVLRRRDGVQDRAVIGPAPVGERVAQLARLGRPADLVQHHVAAQVGRLEI